MIIKKLKVFVMGTIMAFICCDKNEATSSVISPGNDPNFTIVSHTDEGFTSFNRKVVVFGIDIYAVKASEDIKLLHAANVMAQYLDNDEDGIVDDQLVLDNMTQNKAFLAIPSRSPTSDK